MAVAVGCGCASKAAADAVSVADGAALADETACVVGGGSAETGGGVLICCEVSVDATGSGVVSLCAVNPTRMPTASSKNAPIAIKTIAPLFRGGDGG